MEYLRINVKRVTLSGEEIIDEAANEHKSSLPNMYYTAEVRTDELWVFELVSVVHGKVRDFSIVTKLIDGEIVLWEE